MSANEYINSLFQYISDLFKRSPYNECKNGVFPEDFIPTVSTIFKKLFRVYAHVYHHHLNVVSAALADALVLYPSGGGDASEHRFQTLRDVRAAVQAD